MNSRQSGSTAIVRVACAIVFISFIFLFLYDYQAPTLMYVQHALSEGQTTYNALVGALIITVILVLVQLFTSKMLRFANASHSLSYAPSMTLLALLTNVRATDEGPSMGSFIFFLPFIILLLMFLFRLAKQWIRIPQKSGGVLSSEELLLNVLTMVVMFFSVIAFANGDRRFKAQVMAERALQDGNSEGVMRACESFRQADTTLTFFRAKILDANHTLGDSLFLLPTVGNSDVLTKGNGVRRLLGYKVNAKKKRFSADYVLCGHLLDRDLDAFAQRIRRFYAINDSLPRHYKEALILYRHLRSNPVAVYSNDVMDSDYRNMQELLRKNTSMAGRRKVLEQHYKESYWRYYYTK